MDVVPTIRTAPPPAPPSHYQAHLNSPDWRRVRNRALKNAGWKCERCRSDRDLQVHHRTYERLGCERDQDLEVLCANCHEDEHIEQIEQSPDRIYLKLASEALARRVYASIGDLSEDVKLRCVALKITYDGPKIHRALELITGTRLQRIEAPTRRDGTKPPALQFGRQEAHELLCRLGFRGEIERFCKSMPAVGKSPGEQRAHEERMFAQIKAEQKEQYQREHKPESTREALERIFSTRPA